MNEAPDAHALAKAREMITEVGEMITKVGEYLYLVRCNLGPAELRALERELQGCQGVEVMDLRRNRLGKRSLLARAKRSNRPFGPEYSGSWSRSNRPFGPEYSGSWSRSNRPFGPEYRLKRV